MPADAVESAHPILEQIHRRARDRGLVGRDRSTARECCIARARCRPSRAPRHPPGHGMPASSSTRSAAMANRSSRQSTASNCAPASMRGLERRHTLFDREPVGLEHERRVGLDAGGVERLLIAEQSQVRRLGRVAPDHAEERDPLPPLPEERFHAVARCRDVVDHDVIRRERAGALTQQHQRACRAAAARSPWCRCGPAGRSRHRRDPLRGPG